MDQPHFWLRFKGQKGNTVQAVRCKIKLITAKRRNTLWTNAGLCENDVTLECHRGNAEGVRVIECHKLEGKCKARDQLLVVLIQHSFFI